VALFIQFGLFEPNALLWALVGCAPLVPVIDRLLPGERYRWPCPNRTPIETRTTSVTRPRPRPSLELSA